MFDQYSNQFLTPKKIETSSLFINLYKDRIIALTLKLMAAIGQQIQIILTRSQWVETKMTGRVPRNPHDQTFIHATYTSQTEKIRAKKYSHDPEAVILNLSKLQLENSGIKILEENGYPHLYTYQMTDQIPIDAIMQ